MKIPALQEISPTGLDRVHRPMLWGWWDGVCQCWHVLPRGQEIRLVEAIKFTSGFRIICIGGAEYVFDESSRLLVPA